ncbi:MAG: hypothetical protein N2Z79_03785 [Candidatus Omnitrophica bacterium]|nr:hypothetical protein [Candidatus Omnitrophota bacterium]
MNNFEELVTKLYRIWKFKKDKSLTHPDEEELVCFLEDRLSEEEKRNIRRHIIDCSICAQNLATRLSIGEEFKEMHVSSALIEKIKEIIDAQTENFIEIILKLKGKVLELIYTQADVLLRNELLPAPVLRSKNIKDFDSEIYFLRDFAELRIEIKIEARPQNLFDLSLIVKDKKTNQIIKDLRVSLFKDQLEIESYITSTGKISFENLKPATYKIEISSIESKFATIFLEVRI